MGLLDIAIKAAPVIIDIIKDLSDDGKRNKSYHYEDDDDDDKYDDYEEV